MSIEARYMLAKEKYAGIGVNTDNAVSILENTPVSIPCWQGDDAHGFEAPNSVLTGGVQVTGNYPGRARTLEELRCDAIKALSYVPGKNKVNLHAFYLDNQGKFVDRDQLLPQHFSSWADWAVENRLGLDFNPSFFCHPKDSEGYTLSSSNNDLRAFWIEHGKRSRAVAAYLGERTQQPTVCCVWIPDGEKEVPIDTLSPRLRLIDSLNQIFDHNADSKYLVDAVESKLYGIGTEGYNVGTHEFYMSYAASRPELYYTLDMGHFHPCEMISEKISSCLLSAKGLLLHIGRPVRWNSGHVTTLDDETRNIMNEIVRLDAIDRVSIALDYADASINRIMAWAIGARNTKKALLEALLQPVDRLKALEQEKDYSQRLALLEECKYMPFADVWDYICEKNNVLSGLDWINDAKQYERDVLSFRN